MPNNTIPSAAALPNQVSNLMMLNINSRAKEKTLFLRPSIYLAAQRECYAASQRFMRTFNLWAQQHTHSRKLVSVFVPLGVYVFFIF